MKRKLLVIILLVQSISGIEKEIKELATFRIPKPTAQQVLNILMIRNINKFIEKLSSHYSIEEIYKSFKELYIYLNKEGLDQYKQLIPLEEMTDLSKELLNNVNELACGYLNSLFSKKYPDFSKQYWASLNRILNDIIHMEAWVIEHPTF